jgi:mono/diheme cytochrome c family protein
MNERGAHRARTVALALALAAPGCGGATSSSAGPEAPPSATAPASPEAEPSEQAEAEKPAATSGTPESDSPTERLMQEHFKSANAIRLAVIAGNRDEIFKPSRKLVYLSDVEELPPSWQGPVQRMQNSAERLKDSNDMATAAAAMADVGTSCGLCHQKLGGPHSELQAPPSSNGSLVERMQQHAWATERLWEGLYVPSSEAWSAGIAVLTDRPFPDEVLRERGVYARSAAQDFAKVVATAPREANAEQKAAVYAKLLTTCAACHLAPP